jgi:hypothetical protein
MKPAKSSITYENENIGSEAAIEAALNSGAEWDQLIDWDNRIYSRAAEPATFYRVVSRTVFFGSSTLGTAKGCWSRLFLERFTRKLGKDGSEIRVRCGDAFVSGWRFLQEFTPENLSQAELAAYRKQFAAIAATDKAAEEKEIEFRKAEAERRAEPPTIRLAQSAPTQA